MEVEVDCFRFGYSVFEEGDPLGEESVVGAGGFEGDVLLLGGLFPDKEVEELVGLGGGEGRGELVEI